MSTTCAVCGAGGGEELFPSTMRPEDFTAERFSARRSPDRKHYRIVRCTNCSLVRSDPVLPADAIGGLYRASHFDYAAESRNLQATYRRVLARMLARFGLRPGGALLEVGCGNGFFLEAASAMGFSHVVGVEPSRDAVSAAPSALRGSLVCDVMRPGLFGADTFDAVCLFHVVDHLSEPTAVLKECLHVLKPGGVLLFVVHDVRAASARLLGERSPIVDVEHTYLFSRETAEALLKKAGADEVLTARLWNTLSGFHLMHLLPLSPDRKATVVRRMPPAVVRVRLRLPLGNLVAAGRKPGGSGA